MRKTPDEALLPGALEKYSHDLTALARQEQFAPLMRRENEVARVIEILSYPLEVRARHRKDNPMLIGEDSQERWAIVAEVVRRISADEVPEALQGSRVIALNLETLLSTTKYPGERRDLFHALLEEVWTSARQTIPFIDEFPTLVGAGRPEQQFGASAELAPALYKWHMQIIGTTNLDDYRKHVERSSVHRCFQEIIVRWRDE